MNRETITVYAVDKNGARFRVAGYDRQTALKVVNDDTVRAIVHAEKLIAVTAKGETIADTEETR